MTTWIRHCNIWEIFHGVRTGENLKQMENASLSQGGWRPLPGITFGNTISLKLYPIYPTDEIVSVSSRPVSTRSARIHKKSQSLDDDFEFRPRNSFSFTTDILCGLCS